MKRALAVASLLAASVSIAPDARAEEVNETVRSVLRDPRYRFCHEDDYPLVHDEHDWCPLVGQYSGACPSLPKACKLPAVERRGFGLWGKSRIRARKAKEGDVPAARPPQEDTRQRPPQMSLRLPDLSGVAQVVFFLLLAVFVVVIVRAIVQNLLRNREPEKKDEEKPPEAKGTEAPAPKGPVETDVERLLARARAAAERGDYGRAVDDAYAALLRRLDGDGLIEIHPSRTNGDYVRALGDRAELRGAVRGIARDVEGVQFGATAPTESVFRSVLARVIPLVSRGLGVLLVFFGLSAALSCTPHDNGDEGGRGDMTPSGTQAVIDVMSKHGLKIRRRSEPLSKLDRPLALVLLPEVSLDPDTWKHVLAWVKDKGGTLIIAGMTSLPEEVQQRIVTDVDESTSVTPAPGVHWVGHPVISVPAGQHVAPEVGPTQELLGVTLLRGEQVFLTERPVGEGHIVVAADDRLFTNVALTVDDDATFLLSLLFRSAQAPEREVEICDAWTGMGAHTPLESLQQARLTPVVIQLFILMALLFLWKGVAFARLRDPPAEARRAFSDHARALGLAYQRARASRHAVGLYAVWALERLRERVQGAGRSGLIPLAEAIAARTGRPVGEVMSVLAEASGARDEAAPPSSFRPASRRDGQVPPARTGRDAGEADLALMQKLMSYLAAFGSKRAPNPPSPPTTPPRA